MSISTYLRPNIHQNGPEILGVKTTEKSNKKLVFELKLHIYKKN
jgi:hypothetical protein